MVKQWLRKFSEAWTACMMCMVQGDLSVLTLNHALTASKTGSIAATALIVATLLGKQNNIWITTWLTGVMVMLADLIAHPTHFGPAWMEAFVTGLVAAMICFTFEKLVKSNG